MIITKNVQKLLHKVEDNAKKTGSVYGMPHVLKEVINTSYFKKAYTGNIDDLKDYIKAAIDAYDPEEINGCQGMDIIAVTNSVLPAFAKVVRADGIISTDDIYVAHLMMAMTTNNDTLNFGEYLLANKIDAMVLFYNILKEEFKESTEFDEDSIDTSKILYNYAFILKGNDVRFLKIPRSETSASAPDDGVIPDGGMMGAQEQVDWTKYTVDLIEKVRTYNKPFVGREDVTERAMQILCKCDKPNPVLVGEPGVGKTAITLGLAKMIANNTVPDVLKGSHMYELDMTAVVAGTMFRGQFENRIKVILDEISKLDKPILFIDEIHMIIGAGAGGNSDMDAANILKPYLTEGKIKFIGATTYKEFSKYIGKDDALMRRFQKVDVAEPSIEDSITILQGLKPHYETYHHVKYNDEAIKAAVELSAKHIHDRFLPDKAIDLIDEAGAYVNVHPEVGAKITEENIETILCKVCKIPEKNLNEDQLEDVSKIDKELALKVFGQDEAIDKVSEAIKLSKSGLGDDEKPIGTFLFVGPSGVGKTELAKQIASTMDINFLRFDMSEYAEAHSVAKLFGSPAGYVGYDDGGILTNAVLKTPHCVLLFDEIEKAHPEVFKSFLQIFDYGMMTDSKGKKVDFRNCIIIMTSNCGVSDAAKSSIGFGNTSGINTSAITDAVNRMFSVEFRNRLTSIIQFNPLSEEMGIKVANKELGQLSVKLAVKNIDVTYTDAAIKQVAKLGTSPAFGAREIQRVVNNQIKKLFVNLIVSGKAPKKCKLDYTDKFVVIPNKSARLTSKKVGAVITK